MQKCLSNNSLLVDHILPNIGLVYFRSKRAGPSMFNQNNVVGPLGELGLKAKSNSLIQCTGIQLVYNDKYRKHDMLYFILKIQNKHSPKVGVDESHCEAVKGFRFPVQFSNFCSCYFEYHRRIMHRRLIKIVHLHQNP